MEVKSRRGFTLIELILVMMVIFTMATLIAPRMTDFFPSFQVQKSTEHLFAWARKARADAAMTGLRQRLLVDTNHRKYWIEYEAHPFKEPGIFKPLGGSWGEETLPDAVRFEMIEGAKPDPNNSASQYIEFSPDGTSTDATVVLTNDRGDRKTIRVEGATARVSIQAENKP